MSKNKCKLRSIVDLPSVDQEVTRNTGSGIEVLGATAGSAEFVYSCLQKRVQKNVSLLENLSYLADPQCALGILRYCLETPRLVYSLSTITTTRNLINVLKVLDSGPRDALDQNIGTVTCDNAWKQ